MACVKKPILRSRIDQTGPEDGRVFAPFRGLRRIGITMGDPAGVGPEVIAGALSDMRRTWPAGLECVVIGNEKIYSRFCPVLDDAVLFADITRSGVLHRPGQPSADSAYDSLRYLAHAVKLLKDGSLSALVTGPVSKEGIVEFQRGFKGHTSFLADTFACPKVEMLFAAPGFNMLLVSRHLPLKDVPAAITRGKVYDAVLSAHEYLKNKFRIVSPRIAVCGLNPHAGEGGHIGREELRTIIPAIKDLLNAGCDVHGPFPADTIFEPRNRKNFDLIVTMYHDQGLPVLKALYFDDLVNVTAGLPFVRTSPAHGTAFDIAGKGVASCGSMGAAIRLAIQLVSR